jgi:hypothetical protein
MRQVGIVLLARVAFAKKCNLLNHAQSLLEILCGFVICFQVLMWVTQQCMRR